MSGGDEREQIGYDSDTGAVTWRYVKGASLSAESVSDEYGTAYTTTFEESEQREITTIEPPV